MGMNVETGKGDIAFNVPPASTDARPVESTLDSIRRHYPDLSPDMLRLVSEVVVDPGWAPPSPPAPGPIAVYEAMVA
jgi:hypothetical protein